MSKENFFDPCKDCELKDEEVCATCEYGVLEKEERCELATREYYGYDVEGEP